MLETRIPDAGTAIARCIGEVGGQVQAAAIAASISFLPVAAAAARSDPAAGSAGKLLWRVQFQGSESSPVAAGGFVYIGARDGAIYAFDAQTGQHRWRVQTGENLKSGPEIIRAPGGSTPGDMLAAVPPTFPPGKREIAATPVVAGGTVFVGSRDRTFYAIDAATGRTRWSHPTGGEIRHPAIARDGAVYFDSDDRFIYALEANSGAKRWAFETLTEIPGDLEWGKPYPQELAQDDSTLYLATAWTVQQSGTQTQAVLYALHSRTGNLRWRIAVEGLLGTPPTVFGGLVLLSTEEPPSPSSSDEKKSSMARVHAVDAATGNIRWQSRAALDSYRPSAVVVARGTAAFATDLGIFAVDVQAGSRRWEIHPEEMQPAIAAGDRWFYVITKKGSMRAVDALTGQVMWSVSVGSHADVRRIQDRVVHVVDGPRFSAFDAETGEKLWSFKTGKVEGKPAVAAGTVFVASGEDLRWGEKARPGHFHAFQGRSGK